MIINNPPRIDQVLDDGGNVLRMRIKTLAELQAMTVADDTVVFVRDSDNKVYLPRCIYSVDSEILKPDSETVANISNANIISNVNVWKRQSDEKYYFPQALKSVDGEILTPDAKAIGDVNTANIIDTVMAWVRNSDSKYYLPEYIFSQTGEKLTQKILTIGDWNMDSTKYISVAHGLGANYVKIRYTIIIVRDDNETKHWPLNVGIDGADPNLLSGGVEYIDSNNVRIFCRSGGLFDGVSFDATSYNRGWIILLYEVS